MSRAHVLPKCILVTEVVHAPRTAHTEATTNQLPGDLVLTLSSELWPSWPSTSDLAPSSCSMIQGSGEDVAEHSTGAGWHGHHCSPGTGKSSFQQDASLTGLQLKASRQGWKHGIASSRAGLLVPLFPTRLGGLRSLPPKHLVYSSPLAIRLQVRPTRDSVSNEKSLKADGAHSNPDLISVQPRPLAHVNCEVMEAPIPTPFSCSVSPEFWRPLGLPFLRGSDGKPYRAFGHHK